MHWLQPIAMRGWRWLRERSKIAPMKRAIMFFAIAATTLAVTACASNGPREYPGVQLKPAANPSAVVAAELAFARLAQIKGQWTAFSETATADAEMFVPLRVNAQGWLKGKADPAVAVKWQPHEVWSSCDGSYAITRGAWQGPKAVGYFITIWQRQKDGRYKWVLDQGDILKEAGPVPDMIEAKVADCSPVTSAVAIASGRLDGSSVDEKTVSSPDGSLEWTSVVLADGARNFSVRMWLDGEMRDVLISEVAAPAP